VLSGTDVECGSNYKRLVDAVERGDISEGDIDVSVRRLLVERFKVGDMTPDSLVQWTAISPSVVASKEHKQLALDMARQGAVLLQNNGGLLPLSKSGQNIVVMGPNAADSVMQWGNYMGYPSATTTILQGIRSKAAGVKYVQACGLTRGEVNDSRYSLLQTEGGRHGMKATYWNNEDMEGDPAAVAYMGEPINLSNGGATVFAPGVNLEHFSARYAGKLVATRSERLTFVLGADDKARLIVNGDTLCNNWKSRQRINVSKPQLDVVAGKEYDIQIDYVQGSEVAVMQFDVVKHIVPTIDEILGEVGDASVVVFVGGISPSLEGEEMKVSEPGFKGGDRTDIELPAVQRDLLAKLHEAGKRVVLVNCSGGAMALKPESEACDAILQAWYPGEKGGEAIADILFGDCNPSGKLPVTFYASTADLPDFLDYKMENRTYRYFRGKALYPFGYGLSYTTFELSRPKYDATSGTISVEVANTGRQDGTETVQVYVRNPRDVDGPLKTLRAYKRVAVEAGKSVSAVIDLPRSSFELWDATTNTMRVVPGAYEVYVGTSSDDGDLQRLSVNVKDE